MDRARLVVCRPHASRRHQRTLFERVVRDELAEPDVAAVLRRAALVFRANVGVKRRVKTPRPIASDGPRDAFTSDCAGGSLYRRWLADGDSVLEHRNLAGIRDASRGDGVIESEVLAHSYRHLSPLANLVRARMPGVEEGNGRQEGPQPRRQKGRRRFAALNRGSSCCDHEEPWRERPPGAQEGVPRRVRGRSRRGSSQSLLVIPVGDREVGRERGQGHGARQCGNQSSAERCPARAVISGFLKEKRRSSTSDVGQRLKAREAGFWQPSAFQCATSRL